MELQPQYLQRLQPSFDFLFWSQLDFATSIDSLVPQSAICLSVSLFTEELFNRLQ